MYQSVYTTVGCTDQEKVTSEVCQSVFVSPSLRQLLLLLFLLRVWSVRRLSAGFPSGAFLLHQMDVELPDGEDAGEHGLHGGVVQGGGGEPEGAVGDAASLRQKVEDVGALLDRLRAGRKTDGVTSAG